LRESGFVEGKNIVIERRETGGRPDLAAQAAAELIGLHVDVLLVCATPATRAAKAATKTVPIVMWGVSDPVERGLVVSLAKPEGNITGVADFSTSLLPKQLELLKAAAPKVSRVAFVSEDPARFYSAEVADSLKRQHDAAARRLGMSRVDIVMNSPQDFAGATVRILQEGADALLIDASGTNFALAKELSEFAVGHRLPTVGNTAVALAGQLLSYGVNYVDEYRKAGTYVAKILNGAKPADLPIEQPTEVDLIINLKTAKAIGLTIPQSLLLLANRVIE
jgi:putative tryptophan/tyrosine transport system substrate-binding protein